MEKTFSAPSGGGTVAVACPSCGADLGVYSVTYPSFADANLTSFYLDGVGCVRCGASLKLSGDYNSLTIEVATATPVSE